MGIVNIINLVVLIVFTVAGLIIGLVKGFKNAKSWGSDFLLSALATVGTGAILKVCDVSEKIAGIIVFACAIAFILLFTGLSKLVRHILERKFEQREDDMQKLGSVGVVNRLFGGYALAVKGFVIAASLCGLVYTVIDLTQIESLKSALDSVYEGNVWQMIKPYIFDFIILGIINLAVRHGFSNGISSALWGLIVLGLIAGSGFAAYNLVFKTELFDGAAESLGVRLEDMITNSDLSFTVAQWLWVVILFVLMAVAVGVTSFFVSRVITFARLGTAYGVVDGILGAIVLTVIFTGAILFLGFLLEPISDLKFMTPFTDYFDGSTFARFFYTDNILTGFGLPELLPLRDWITGA